MGQVLVVISALAVYNGHSVIELTICSDGVQLTSNNVVVGDNTGSGTSVAHLWHYKSTTEPVSKGTYVYFSDQNQADFAAFFGFTPSYYQMDPTVLFNGTENFAAGNSSEATDAYGIFGVDHTGGPADFSKGWVGRKRNRPPTLNFNINDWNVHPGATSNNPATNAQSIYPIQLGVYTCTVPTMSPSSSPPMATPPPPPTHSPSGPPTLRPTLAKRLRQPVVPDPQPTEAPSSPLPVGILLPPSRKPHNPPRSPENRNRNRRPN